MLSPDPSILRIHAMRWMLHMMQTGKPIGYTVVSLDDGLLENT